MGDPTDKYSLDWCANQGDRLNLGEPRRRKGRRGNTNPLSKEELQMMRIRTPGVYNELGRKLAKILKK
jgi:hypothetical protein